MPEAKEKIVVIGNGMVSYKFCERLSEYDTTGNYQITVLGEEVRPAYDRVHLTSFFSEATVEDLIIEASDWYKEKEIDLRLSSRVLSINKTDKTVSLENGETLSYDKLIISTGSSPFIPQLPGIDKEGVFAYRTIEDLESIIEYSKKSKKAVVIGGGLLGLEAAKACVDLRLHTTVIEMAPRLMPRQLDSKASDILVKSIQQLGVNVLTNVLTNNISGNDRVEKIDFKDGRSMEVDMVIVSAGIVPNDQLAKEGVLETGPRGGIVVDSNLLTSEKDIYAIGECALYEGMIYGLIAPGNDMADIVAYNLCSEDKKEFHGADMSTKLKLMGIDVASLGDPFTESDIEVVELYDNHSGIYKKMIMDSDGKKLKGAILVGDASEYGPLSLYVRGNKELPDNPQSLIIKGHGASGFSVESMEEEDVVCSCNNVTFGDICKSIEQDGLTTVPEIKAATKAGTSCGGCLPMVKSVLVHKLEEMGVEFDNTICQHFKYTRQELFDIIKINGIRTFDELLQSHGTGSGCELCKPIAASIFASIWNNFAFEHFQIQDSNDQYFGNIQRNGTYSVIPRSPGGELTPEQLITMGEIAKDLNLYTKLTGSQRVGLFGAHVGDLPAIWKRLNAVGLESGHAYAKGLRMVKSCVGSTWCRFGIGPSVDFAIELENRYKGLRAPHKYKAAVSGCTRECAEVSSKDFGLIATEHGWNLYVCGNGGTFPRHADLLAQDIDKETAVKYLDRFLMYYIQTADKLQRTSTWLMNLDGGIEKLRSVIIDDSLGICETLEKDMQDYINSQHDEWSVALKNQKVLEKFSHFVNSEEKDPVPLITVRGQQKPRLWQDTYEVEETDPVALEGEREWVDFGEASLIEEGRGGTFKYNDFQIAVFNFGKNGQWYACQNLCPHKQEMVLSRGLLGDIDGIPKIACPIHKKAFSLESGKSVTGEIYSIQTFKVEIRKGNIFVELPSDEALRKLHICDVARGESNVCKC